MVFVALYEPLGYTTYMFYYINYIIDICDM